jgi:hypothetical protein
MEWLPWSRGRAEVCHSADPGSILAGGQIFLKSKLIHVFMCGKNNLYMSSKNFSTIIFLLNKRWQLIFSSQSSFCVVKSNVHVCSKNNTLYFYTIIFILLHTLA